MKKNRFIAALLSCIVPGLGQLYVEKHYWGALIMFGAIVIANLNIIVLPLIAMANGGPLPPADPNALWRYWISRVVHDVSALWTIAFWIWAIYDAYHMANRQNKICTP